MHLLDAAILIVMYIVQPPKEGLRKNQHLHILDVSEMVDTRMPHYMAKLIGNMMITHNLQGSKVI